jgi:hypothetical protein
VFHPEQEVGSSVGIRTSADCKLCQKGGQRQVAHQFPRVGPVPAGPGVQARQVATVLILKAH